MKETSKKPLFFFLTDKEEAAMKVLWNSDKPLSATEIAEGIPNRTWPVSSIQGILRNLEKKNAIIIDSITKLGKSYGRLFRPALSANEYASMQFKHYYQDHDNNYFSMISSLLGNTKDHKEEIVEALESLLAEYKEE